MQAQSQSLSQRIHLWTWTARAALCNQWSISPCRVRAFAVDNIKPSHLWDDDWSNSWTLQTSAGRQCLWWLHLSYLNHCFCSMGFDTGLPEQSQQLYIVFSLRNNCYMSRFSGVIVVQARPVDVEQKKIENKNVISHRRLTHECSTAPQSKNHFTTHPNARNLVRQNGVKEKTNVCIFFTQDLVVMWLHTWFTIFTRTHS